MQPFRFAAIVLMGTGIACAQSNSHPPHPARAGCAGECRLERSAGRAEGAEDARSELDG